MSGKQITLKNIDNRLQELVCFLTVRTFFGFGLVEIALSIYYMMTYSDKTSF